MKKYIIGFVVGFIAASCLAFLYNYATATFCGGVTPVELPLPLVTNS